MRATTHKKTSVIIHNFNFESMPLLPAKTYAPSSIDANTMLACAVTFKSFQPVSRRRGKLFKPRHSIQLLQLSECDSGNGLEFPVVANLE